MENKYQIQSILQVWDKVANQTAEIENYNYKTKVLCVRNFTFFFTNKIYIDIAKRAIESGNKKTLIKYIYPLNLIK